MKLTGYFQFIIIGIKESFFYSTRTMMMVLSQVTRIILVLIIYKSAFNYIGNDVNGVGFTETIWSIGVYFVILSPRIAYIFRVYSEEIRSGNVELQINKPFNYVGKKIADYSGKGLLSLFLAIITIPILILILVGIPEFDFGFLWLVYSFVIFVSGFLLALITFSLVGLTCFWLEDSNPVYWIVDKLSMVLGGSYVPVAMFPLALRMIAENTPFGAMFFSTQMFNESFILNAPRFIAVQFFWISIGFISLNILYSKAQRKLSVNGG